MTFHKVLVANRGEIAVRIMKTCREMGLATVAVYSEADRQAPHVSQGDQAVFLGASAPIRGYLAQDRIVAAARETGAEAIHPGYGFLAENPEFAERCAAEGLIFIGPPARAIRELGHKTTARRIARQNGVPVVPGLDHPEADPQVLARTADEIGYPVLIKAAAGGGGKGMRVVADPGYLLQACQEAAGEARNAFGDGTIYLEKYLNRPRHVEIQIMADHHGHAIHLLERECSIQRRHQKIVEETPCPVMPPELRELMGRAALTMARASGYVNAGTVEFLLDQEGRFYFLEVNTRLQVEHPITEMITGLDLVRLQLEIAAGQPLSLTQVGVVGRGHAIECRVYAEDPAHGFRPSPGRITYLAEPSGPGVRIDGGIRSGYVVPVDYDPILSKLIVHGPDRKQALARMVSALREYVVLGPRTTIPFLIDVIDSPAFGSGQTDTNFIPTHFPDWKPRRPDLDLAGLAFIVDEWNGSGANPAGTPRLESPTSPWRAIGAWGRG